MTASWPVMSRIISSSSKPSSRRVGCSTAARNSSTDTSVGWVLFSAIGVVSQTRGGCVSKTGQQPVIACSGDFRSPAHPPVPPGGRLLRPALPGNPLAVVVDAEGLSTGTMQHFANWTNLSETTFLLPPTASPCGLQGADLHGQRGVPLRGASHAGLGAHVAAGRGSAQGWTASWSRSAAPVW